MNNTSCLDCKHYHIKGKTAGACDAFPDGIPFIINSGEVNHDKPLPNQNNDIVFEPIKKEA